MLEPSILLAEDDEHDVFFMERAFAKAGIQANLFAVRNGAEAVDYLQSAGQVRPLPRLLLLDLKMPLMDGFEVLSWLQQQPKLREKFPVVVLTSSAQDSDRNKALTLGASEYLVKPHEFDGLVHLVSELKSRWLHAAGNPGSN